MAKVFLTTATAEFMNLQSGNAAPYFYIEAIVSGVTAIIGDSNTSTNWLMDGGQIDREKPVFPGDRSNIFSSDVTIKADNSDRRFSPLDSASIFFGNDYLESPFNYWAGFQNVSGTALLVQRGSFVLENLRIDSRATVAYMRLKDKFKRALDFSIGGTDVSGTSIQYVASGVLDGKSVMESLLITGAGLTGGDLSIATASISFNNISFNEQTVADALSQVAEASDGYIFTSRRGILTFFSNAPSFATSTAAFSLNESNYIQNIFYEQTKDDRLTKVTVEYSSGTALSTVSQLTGTTGNSITISNDAIQGESEAGAIASRTRDRFSGQVTRIEIASVWLPSIDLGDNLSITSSGLGLSSSVFEVYKIQEEPSIGQMRLFLLTQRTLKDRESNKFFFWSDTSAVVCGTIFTGATGEANGWQENFMFWARDTVTATNPGFDADGDANNVINTGLTVSGAGGSGIENPFVWY